MKYLKRYNESEFSDLQKRAGVDKRVRFTEDDNVLDYYALEDILLPLNDILGDFCEIDMSTINHDNGKLTSTNNNFNLYFRGKAHKSGFIFKDERYNEITYDSLIDFMGDKSTELKDKIKDLQEFDNSISNIKNRLQDEMPDIIHRLEQYDNFRRISFGASTTPAGPLYDFNDKTRIFVTIYIKLFK